VPRETRLLGVKVELPLHPEDASMIEDVKIGVGILREKVSKAAGLVLFSKDERERVLRMLRTVEGIAAGILDASTVASAAPR
jgi:hypothetical protein